MPKSDTQFSKTRQPKNPGRKPAHLKRYLKDNGIGTADVRAILGGILTNATSIEKVREMLKDPKTPPIILFPLSALLKDMMTGRLDAFSFLMRYGYGEPKQEIESKNENINFEGMNKKELEDYEDELIRKFVLEKKDKIKEIMKDDIENGNS